MQPKNTLLPINISATSRNSSQDSETLSHSFSRFDTETILGDNLAINDDTMDVSLDENDPNITPSSSPLSPMDASDIGEEDINNSASTPENSKTSKTKLSRKYLRDNKWYRWKKVYLERFDWIRYDAAKKEAYCSYPSCKT